MLDPFDQSSLQGIYSNTRFSGERGEESDAAARLADGLLAGSASVAAAGRSAERSVEAARFTAKSRLKAAKRAAAYREEEQRRARQASEPSTGEKIASGIGTAASVVGSVAGVAAAI